MRHSKGLSAFTLIEILVAMFVSSILLTVLVQMFSVSVKTGTEELERASTETTALFVLRRVEADLQNSAPAGITLSLSGEQLAIHPMDEALSTGQVTYLNRLILWDFDPEQKRLRRTVNEEWFSSFDFRPHRLDSTEMSALQANNEAKIAQILSKVSHFEVSNPADVLPPSVGSPLSITVTAKIDQARSRSDVTLKKSVWIRSSGN